MILLVLRPAEAGAVSIASSWTDPGGSLVSRNIQLLEIPVLWVRICVRGSELQSGHTRSKVELAINLHLTMLLDLLQSLPQPVKPFRRLAKAGKLAC